MTFDSAEGGVGHDARRPLFGRARRHLSRVAGVAALVVVVGCGRSGAEPAPLAVDPFFGSTGSLEELGDQVITGLAAGESGVLAGLRLSEQEHNEVLWPELPVSDPSLNVPLDYVWTDIELRNQAALDRIGTWYRDRDVRLRSVDCGGVQEFETFRVLTDCWVVFDDEGVEPRVGYRAQVFKDVVERGGGYKVFRYYEELPEPIDG